MMPLIFYVIRLIIFLSPLPTQKPNDRVKQIQHHCQLHLGFQLSQRTPSYANKIQEFSGTISASSFGYIAGY